MKILGVIPSRYGSTRFPGKPLIDINGKSMIQRVYEQCKKSEVLSEVIVATDDQRIFEHVESFNGKVVMTSSSHNSGTERCAEVVSNMKAAFDIIINIQGDEPFIDPNQIAELSSCFMDDKADIATLVKPIKSIDELFNPNRPKVEFDKFNFALMFSRNVIPQLPNIKKEDWIKHHLFYKHVGIYGYRSKILTEISSIPPTPLELKEGLEQLRWLESNYSIKVAITHHEAIAIDTPEDLEKITME